MKKTIIGVSLLLILLSQSLAFGQKKKAKQIRIFPALEIYVKELPNEFSKISADRKENLQEAGDYITKQLKLNQQVNLLFICTHNSRRSQIGQVWANVASIYYGFDQKRIATFSGGTEATAFNERAVNALKKAGFKIEKNVGVKNNPRYSVSFSMDKGTFFMYSKKFSDIQNPQRNFAALMVCSQAAETCPIVPGADIRVLMPYEDPKSYDGKPEETQKYDETCRLIAREMFFLFEYVKSQIKDFESITK
jgi:arsenate reductase (thioredoxin)